MRRHLLILLIWLSFSPAAHSIEFDNSWTSQGFPGRKANTYRLEGAGLGLFLSLRWVESRDVARRPRAAFRIWSSAVETESAAPNRPASQRPYDS